MGIYGLPDAWQLFGVPQMSGGRSHWAAVSAGVPTSVSV